MPITNIRSLSTLLFLVFAAVCITISSAESESPNQEAASGEPLPPDLPLPQSPPNQAAWLREANVLQPVLPSHVTALVDPGDRPQRLRKEFGFNAIVVQPTDSHNAFAPAKYHVTDEQFRAGLAAYRAAGYRIVLYTSVMAMGISPEFQSGEIARKHPEWQQRDAQGNPVMVWGVPWLCPSTGAREAALQRCLRIVEDYQADGVLLDNNQFYFTEGGGWTCHCEACTQGFRQYVDRRFGVEGARRHFGAAPAELAIPVQEGPLHALWLHWRNRVWADVNESFRARLRQANPDVVLFANTQYLFDTGVLASDLQYEREDVVVSETVGLDSRMISQKLALGHALAAGRPLWNYIGAFARPEDYTGLKPASVIGPMIAATLAHGAQPWIVDGFDEEPTDPEARREMSRLLGWHAEHRELFSADPWAEVATIVSLESRNNLKRPLIPPHVATLQAAGTPVIALRDGDATDASLQPFRFVTVETAGYLSESTADALAKWVRGGGTLIANRDVGFFDELGRKRTASTLWSALGLPAAPTAETKLGRGVIIAPEASDFAQAATDKSRACSFQVAPESGVEVVAYRAPESLLLHVLRHHPADAPTGLRLPPSLHPVELTAQVFVPGSQEAPSQSLSRDGDGVFLELATVPSYCVVKIPIR